MNPLVLYACGWLEGEIHARTPTHTRLHTHTSSSSIYSHTHTRTHSNLEQPRTASPLLSTTRRQYNIGSIISSGYAPLTPLLLSFCLLLYLTFSPHPTHSLTSYLLPLTSYFLPLILLFSFSPSVPSSLLLPSLFYIYTSPSLLFSPSLLLSPSTSLLSYLLFSFSFSFSFSPSVPSSLLLPSLFYIYTSLSLLFSPFLSFSPSPPSLSLTSYLLPLILLLSFSPSVPSSLPLPSLFDIYTWINVLN